MDPYLEQRWPAVHAALITDTWRLLNRKLPEDLIATMEERVAVDADDQPSRRIGPDVYVEHHATGPVFGAEGTLVIDAPFRMVLDMDPVIERFVKIVSDAGRVITVIEFLSPSNKLDGLSEFKQKRSELLAAGVHLVEIDLVRGGDWLGLFEPRPFPPEAVSTYRAIVRTATGRAAVHIFPIHLKDSLPDVPVPLRAADPKVFLPLQPMIDTIYTDGRYGRTLKYDRPLDPPLWPDEAAYAAERLAARAGQ
jgi:hypothetical protein